MWQTRWIISYNLAKRKRLLFIKHSIFYPDQLQHQQHFHPNLLQFQYFYSIHPPSWRLHRLAALLDIFAASDKLEPEKKIAISDVALPKRRWFIVMGPPSEGLMSGLFPRGLEFIIFATWKRLVCNYPWFKILLISFVTNCKMSKG